MCWGALDYATVIELNGSAELVQSGLLVYCLFFLSFSASALFLFGLLLIRCAAI